MTSYNLTNENNCNTKIKLAKTILLFLGLSKNRRHIIYLVQLTRSKYFPGKINTSSTLAQSLSTTFHSLLENNHHLMNQSFFGAGCVMP